MAEAMMRQQILNHFKVGSGVSCMFEPLHANLRIGCWRTFLFITWRGWPVSLCVHNHVGTMFMGCQGCPKLGPFPSRPTEYQHKQNRLSMAHFLFLPKSYRHARKVARKKQFWIET
jgi:hypothetical protein